MGAEAAEISSLLRASGIATLEPAPPAADFHLPSLQGDLRSLSQARGRWVVLTFFATWCGPCRAEMPTLEQLHRHLGGQGVVVLGVSIDDRSESVEPFLRRLGVTFPVVWDERGEAARAYQARSIPVTYLIDPTGRVAGVSRGARDWSELGGTLVQLASLAAAAPDAGAVAAASAPGGPAAVGTAADLDLPGDLAPPTATVVLAPSEPRVGQPFHLDVRVRWAGSLEPYVLLPPSLTTPEGVEQRGLSAETTSEAGRDIVTYRVALAARRPGEYSLGPLELRYAPRGSDEPLTSRVQVPAVRVRPRTWAGLSPILLATTGSGAAAAGLAALGLVRRRRRRNRREPTADPRLASLEQALLEARRLRLAGDPVASFLCVARAARELGIDADEATRLAAAEERARYGNQAPPTDELDHLTRHVERRLADLAPSGLRQDSQSLTPSLTPGSGRAGRAGGGLIASARQRRRAASRGAEALRAVLLRSTSEEETR